MATAATDLVRVLKDGGTVLAKVGPDYDIDETDVPVVG